MMILAGIVIFVLAIRLVLLVREAQWHAAGKAAVARTRRAALPARPAGSEFPEPVRRYLRQAIPMGAAAPSMVRIYSHGQFLVRPPTGWGPFRAEQHFTIRPPSMIWEARIRMLPGIDVLVRDAFVEGKGSTHASVLGAWPVLDTEGTGQIAAAALQRYLAEAVWFPFALLPENGVQWQALDSSRARATLIFGSVTATLEFRFGEDGIVCEVFAPERAREVGGRMIPTPWRARHDAYRTMDGFVIPTRAEVEWVLPEGPLPYWRGEVDEVQHDPKG